jgi:Cu/Ag efflux pump CusA
MIRKLLDFCIRERLVVLLGTVVVIAYGCYAVQKVPLDAIPNVGENQVIVLTKWMGQSPKDIEDQITYPLSIALQAVPGAESVRGKSMFGFSFVQVTFADSVDFYWARSRVAEQLTTVTTLAALVPVLVATGRGADVARAMALPVFGGMLIEPFTSFIVPTMYCGYMELTMRFGGREMSDTEEVQTIDEKGAMEAKAA